MPRLFTLLLAALMLTCLTACDSANDHGHDHDADADAFNPFAQVSKAVCVLSPTTGTELTAVTGTITFTQTKSGLLVEADVTGLKPNAKHGFHVHMWGDISDTESAKATGGHYDPTGKAPHGLPSSHDHGHGEDAHTHHMTGGHAGDFGNLETDENGNAKYSKTFENITLTEQNAIIGRAIIVHLGEDDGGQPTGNAGPRVAQGVIGIANPE